MFVSIIFFLIILLVYGLTQQLKSLSGKSFVCYVLCLIIKQILLAAIIIFRQRKVLEYFYLTANWMCFFWLHVLGFDIFAAFSDDRRKYHDKKLLFYCTYAFGFPIIFGIAFFIYDDQNFIKFDEENYLNTSKNITSTFLLLTPVIYTAILNTVLFSMTKYKIESLKDFIVGKQHFDNERARWV